MHAPLISLSAGQWFTDTTNAYRAYSRHYLEHPEVQPFRDIFQTYELLAYLSVRASQLGLKACEIPVTRAYPPKGKVPTKISFFKGNFNLFATLVKNLFRKYHHKNSPLVNHGFYLSRKRSIRQKYMPLLLCIRRHLGPSPFPVHS